VFVFVCLFVKCDHVVTLATNHGAPHPTFSTIRNALYKTMHVCSFTSLKTLEQSLLNLESLLLLEKVPYKNFEVKPTSTIILLGSVTSREI
jgi:hypothetical protein